MFTGNVFNTTPTVSGPPADELSYAEAFPPLPTTVSGGDGADTMLPASPTSSGKNQWGKKMSVRPTTTTQVCSSTLVVVVVVVVWLTVGCHQMQDVIDREHPSSSSSSRDDSDRASAAATSQPATDGFYVHGAPWSSAAPDTTSRDDFPDLAQVCVVVTTTTAKI